ncbi:MAG: hypothetical protein Q9217_000204 [Psora testacea]
MNNHYSLYSSTPFKVSVGSRTFYVHADAASNKSRPFERLINGFMKEASEGTAKLEGVTPDTFDRFLQWAYKGYYTAPAPSIHEMEEDSTDDNGKERVYDEKEQHLEVEEEATMKSIPPIPEEPERPPSHWSHKNGKKKTKPGKRGMFDGWRETTTSPESTPASRQSLKESFIECKPIQRRHSIDIPQPRSNKDKGEDYTEVFLCHAHIYVFAERYDIQELKLLALEELHETLAIFTLFEERTRDIVALLQYAYANTVKLSYIDNELRSLLADYIGFEMATLMKDPEFKNVMIEDGGDMLGDFMAMVAKRIH